MADTAMRMKEAARRFTSERGLTGFTIEELCDEVGVSRRTFFNYFASKENAVLGIPTRPDTSEADLRFVEGSTTVDGELSPSLVDDLVILMVERWSQLDFDREDGRQLQAALEREPRLITYMMELGTHGLRSDIRLVEQREGLVIGDPRADAVVQIVSTIGRLSVEEHFTNPESDPVPLIIGRRLAAARSVFAPSPTH